MKRSDFHCHAFRADVFRAMQRHYPDAIDPRHDEQGNEVAIRAGAAVAVWEDDGRLQDIDRAAVDLEILSHRPSIAG